jgi:hypothetical protein
MILGTRQIWLNESVDILPLDDILLEINFGPKDDNYRGNCRKK